MAGKKEKDIKKRNVFVSCPSLLRFLYKPSYPCSLEVDVDSLICSDMMKKAVLLLG